MLKSFWKKSFVIKWCNGSFLKQQFWISLRDCYSLAKIYKKASEFRDDRTKYIAANLTKLSCHVVIALQKKL